jgi:transposase InsO family protein
MSSHIDKYVVSCEYCQRNKSYNCSTRDIPQPQAIPSRRFDVISVDLLSGFPTTKNGYDCIVAFTDRLTKCAYISPCHKGSNAKDLSTIFMTTAFRHQGMSRVILSDNGPQFISEFWKQLFTLLGTGIRLTSTYHPQSNGGQEKFNKTLLETLRTYVSHRQDNWDECLIYFEFVYSNSVSPSTGMSPFILSYAQSPRAPWQFLDTYVALDEFVSSDASEMDKGSGAHLASYLGLDIINNVCEVRDSLHRMSDDFRIRNARLAKTHS